MVCQVIRPHNREIVVRFRIVSLSCLRSVRTGCGGAHNLLFSGYRGLIPEGLNDQNVKLTTLIKSSAEIKKISGTITPFPNTPASNSHYSSFRIVTKLWAGKPGFEFRQCHVFYIAHRVHMGSAAHKALYLSGSRGSFPRDELCDM